MTGIVIFNVLMIAIGVAVGTGVVSASRISGILGWLHSIIGITPPAPEKAVLFALVWIGSMIVIVDGLLLLLVFLVLHSMGSG
ncbi:MAG: hypothetical protein WCC04_03860 [Terriglobales bacterium]